MGRKVVGGKVVGGKVVGSKGFGNGILMGSHITLVLFTWWT